MFTMVTIVPYALARCAEIKAEIVVSVVCVCVQQVKQTSKQTNKRILAADNPTNDSTHTYTSESDLVLSAHITHKANA